MKVRLKLKAFYKYVERRINRGIPEIFQSRPAPCVGAQTFTVERPELPTDTIADGSLTCRPGKTVAQFRSVQLP